MIFNRQGVPLSEVLVRAALGRRERHTKPPALVRDEQGEPVYRILRDKTGDAYRVFRALFKQAGRYDGATLRKLRAERRR